MSLIPVAETDYLEQDPVLRGQKYVCLSFLSPEEVLIKKDVFLFRKFLRYVSEDIHAMLDGIKHRFADDPLAQDVVKGIVDRYDYLQSDESMQSNFEFFCSTHPELHDEFHQQNKFQTSIRGLKVRGSYETFPEAENRAQQVRKFDEKFHVYIAEVGCWCPWDPRPDEVQEQVYAETQLNTLMQGYHANASRRQEMHEKRKQLFQAP